MCAGGVLAYLVLIPAIKFFGRVAGRLAPGTVPISQMGAGRDSQAYILYIGAGAVAAGGIISLVRSLPTDLARHEGGSRIAARARARATSLRAPSRTSR